MKEYYKQIKLIANNFTSGTPLFEEVYVNGEDVVFSFDNPFEDDVEESYVVASLLIDKETYDLDVINSKKQVDSLYENKELENIDNDIRNALLNGGFENVNLDFDETNTTDSYYCYTYTLHL